MPNELYLDRSIEVERRLAEFLQSLTNLQANIQTDREIAHEVLSKLPLLLTEEDNVVFDILNNPITLPSVPNMLRQMNVTRLDALEDRATILETISENIEIRATSIETETTSLGTRTTSIETRTTSIETKIIPIGTVLMYAAATEPNGWIFCDGRELNRTVYSNLFQKLGTLYGSGNGTSTFNLPDTRGIFIRGAGTTNRGTGKTANNVSYTGILGNYENDGFQGHKHAAVLYPSGIYTSGTTQAWGVGVLTDTGNGRTDYYGCGVALTDTTNGQPRIRSETNPANISLNYIIYTGVFL